PGIVGGAIRARVASRGRPAPSREAPTRERPPASRAEPPVAVERPTARAEPPVMAERPTPTRAKPPVAPSAPPPRPPTAPSAPPPQPTRRLSPEEAMTGAQPPVRATADSPRRDPPRSAYALLDCPGVVVAEEEFDLTVGISAAPTAGVTGGPMVRPESSVGPYTLSVQVVADGFRL